MPTVRHRPFQLLVMAVVATLLTVGLTPHPASARSSLVRRNVVYNAAFQVMDVYLPATGDRHPLVILVHSGGFKEGSRTSLSGLAETFAAYGVTALSIDYRLAPAHRFPDAFHDVEDAVHYAHVNAAALHADPHKIVLVGYSAGANLALLAALHPDIDVRAVVGAAGVYDLTTVTNPALQADIASYMGLTPPAYGSPINLASRDDPPVLLQFGAFDTVVDPSQSLGMAVALRAHRVPTVIKAYPSGHNVLDPTYTVAVPDMLTYVLAVTT